MPSPDGGDYFVWIGAPDEGSGFLIMFFDEAVDGGLQVDDRSAKALSVDSLKLRQRCGARP